MTNEAEADMPQAGDVRIRYHVAGRCSSLWQGE